jgi:hypothetical protein
LAKSPKKEALTHVKLSSSDVNPTLTLQIPRGKRREKKKPSKNCYFPLDSADPNEFIFPIENEDGDIILTEEVIEKLESLCRKSYVTK